MRLINENEYNDLLVSLTDKALLCKLSTNDVLVNGQESVYFILLEEEEKDLSKDNVVRVAKLIALMSAAPAIGGIVGLFVPVVIIPIIVFAVLFIAIMIVGVKLIINKKDEEK